jgi:hypothetical protein
VWAINAVEKNINAFKEKLSSGDIGCDDHSRESKLLSVLKRYLQAPPKPSYKIPVGMWEKNIITRKYIQQNVSSSSAFINHKMGAINGLDATLRSMVDSGYLHDVDKMRVGSDYGAQGKCYHILNLPKL